MIRPNLLMSRLSLMADRWLGFSIAIACLNFEWLSRVDFSPAMPNLQSLYSCPHVSPPFSRHSNLSTRQANRTECGHGPTVEDKQAGKQLKRARGEIVQL